MSRETKRLLRMIISCKLRMKRLHDALVTIRTYLHSCVSNQRVTARKEPYLRAVRPVHIDGELLRRLKPYRRRLPTKLITHAIAQRKAHLALLGVRVGVDVDACLCALSLPICCCAAAARRGAATVHLRRAQHRMRRSVSGLRLRLSPRRGRHARPPPSSDPRLSPSLLLLRLRRCSAQLFAERQPLDARVRAEHRRPSA